MKPCDRIMPARASRRTLPRYRSSGPISTSCCRTAPAGVKATAPRRSSCAGESGCCPSPGRRLAETHRLGATLRPALRGQRRRISTAPTDLDSGIPARHEPRRRNAAGSARRPGVPLRLRSGVPRKRRLPPAGTAGAGVPWWQTEPRRLGPAAAPERACDRRLKAKGPPHLPKAPTAW